jgi:hypothetical protein
MDQSARRMVPFALLVLLPIGVLAAAIAGQVSSPSATTTAPPTTTTPTSAAQWVANLLATTARAGSAHFTYSHVTASPNPVLRGTIAGSGAVNFTAGTVRVSEVDQQVEFVQSGGLFLPHTGQQPPQNEVLPARSVAQPSRNAVSMIGVGKVAYQSVNGSNGSNGLNGAWMRIGLSRDPRAQLGLQYAVNASVALSGLEGLQPVASVHTLGTARLDGLETTRYLVTNAPLCGRSSNAPGSETLGPTTVWVDSRGRLAQARWTVSTSGTLPSAPTAVFPFGPSKTTATLTFSRFGAPVTITAPRQVVNPGGSSKSFVIRARCAGTM